MSWASFAGAVPALLAAADCVGDAATIGARVVTKLLYEFRRRGGNLGLATVCAAGRVGVRDGRGAGGRVHPSHSGGYGEPVTVALQKEGL